MYLDLFEKQRFHWEKMELTTYHPYPKTPKLDAPYFGMQMTLHTMSLSICNTFRDLVAFHTKQDNSVENFVKISSSLLK